MLKVFCFMEFSRLYFCLVSSLCHFVVEDTTNLPPSPPPSPAAEHFGPLEQGRSKTREYILIYFMSMVSFFSLTIASGVLYHQCICVLVCTGTTTPR